MHGIIDFCPDQPGRNRMYQRQILAKVLLSYCDVFKYFMCQGLFALATQWLLRPKGKNAFRVFISKTRYLDLCYPLILPSTYLTFKYILIFIYGIHNCLYCCCCDATGKVGTHFAFSFLKLGL